MQQTQLELTPPARGDDGVVAGAQLPLPRQEHQHGFAGDALIEPVGFQCSHHLSGQRFALSRRLMAHAHGMTAPLAGEQCSLGQLLHQGLQVERGGHHQQPQLWHQQLPGLAQQGKSQIGFAAALVKFIEDHAIHAFKAWIRLQLPQEQAVGQHLNARGGGDAALQAHAIAHLFAHAFTQLCSQALGRSLGRQPPGLEHQDAAAAGFQQGERNARGFAGARGSLQQHSAACGEPLHQLRQQRLDRQGHGLVCGELAQRTWRAPSTG